VRTTRWVSLGSLVAVVAVAASARVPSAHERLTAVTWVRDVEPIMRERCAGCHGPNGVASPALSDFNNAARAAAKMKAQVLTRQMPPWPAAPGFGDFANDASLTPYEIEVLVSWADAGMPRGLADPALPSVALPPSHTTSSEPDVVLQPERDVPVLSNRQRYVLPTRLSRDQWLRGWEFRPGNAALVRQARIVLEPGGVLGVWVPPQSPVLFPRGTGRKLPAGSKVVLEVEYERPADATSDRSGVGLYFGSAPARELQQMSLQRGTVTLREDVVAFSVRPRLDTEGESVRVLAERPDGHSEVLVWVRSHDPHHQITYRFRRPVTLPAGTRLTMFAFDATSAADLEYARR
jgi:hypothetical protein